MTAELTWLLNALRVWLNEGRIPPVADAGIEAKVDPRRLAALITKHNVAGIMSASQKQSDGQQIFSATDIDSVAVEQSWTNLRLISLLRTLLIDWQARGINPVVLKGPAISSLYPDLSQRFFEDLDLLVPVAAAADCIAALEKLGFTSQHALNGSDPRQAVERLSKLTLWRAADDTKVDLHWRVEAIESGLLPQPEDLLRAAIPCRYAGLEFLQLHPEDQVQYLCVHGARHCWQRLFWVLDLARLGIEERVDWHRVEHRMTERGATTILQTVRFLCREHLGVDPAGTLKEADRESTARLLAATSIKLWDRYPGWAGPDEKALYFLRCHDFAQLRIRRLLQLLLLREPQTGSRAGHFLRRSSRPIRLLLRYVRGRSLVPGRGRVSP